MLHRREAIQCHIRTFVIIKPATVWHTPAIPQRGKQVPPQPAITHCPVISLNISVLLRFTRLNKTQGYILLSCPQHQYLAGYRIVLLPVYPSIQ